MPSIYNLPLDKITSMHLQLNIYISFLDTRHSHLQPCAETHCCLGISLNKEVLGTCLLDAL